MLAIHGQRGRARKAQQFDQSSGKMKDAIVVDPCNECGCETEEGQRYCPGAGLNSFLHPCCGLASKSLDRIAIAKDKAEPDPSKKKNVAHLREIRDKKTVEYHRLLIDSF